MKHFHLEWRHDFPDDPVWMAYEVGDDLWVIRMIEHFADGRTVFMKGEDDMCDQPFDPDTFGPIGPDMTLTEIAATRFEALWAGRP